MSIELTPKALACLREARVAATTNVRLSPEDLAATGLSGGFSSKVVGRGGILGIAMINKEYTACMRGAEEFTGTSTDCRGVAKKVSDFLTNAGQPLSVMTHTSGLGGISSTNLGIGVAAGFIGYKAEHYCARGK